MKSDVFSCLLLCTGGMAAAHAADICGKEAQDHAEVYVYGTVCEGGKHDLFAAPSGEKALNALQSWGERYRKMCGRDLLSASSDKINAWVETPEMKEIIETDKARAAYCARTMPKVKTILNIR